MLGAFWEPSYGLPNSETEQYSDSPVDLSNSRDAMSFGSVGRSTSISRVGREGQAAFWRTNRAFSDATIRQGNEVMEEPREEPRKEADDRI
jgi:hypothetical protein